MADAESSRILKRRACVLTEATRELAVRAALSPPCACPDNLPIQVPQPQTGSLEITVEGHPVLSGGSARLLLTVNHGRAVDLTSYVQAADGSPLLFTLPVNIGGSVELAGSILTAYQTTPYLPITISSLEESGSMILNIILTVPTFVTPSESNYILSKVAACPLYTLNKIPPNPCQFTTVPNQGSFTPFPSPASPLNPYPYVTTPPNELHQYRSIPRIRKIDQITTVVRSQSSSESTTRRKTATIQGHVSSTNPFFRKSLPALPCPVPFEARPPYPPDRPCRIRRL